MEEALEVDMEADMVGAMDTSTVAIIMAGKCRRIDTLVLTNFVRVYFINLQVTDSRDSSQVI